MIRVLAVLGVIAGLGGAAAQAQTLIDATDPIGILEIARSYGSADITKDDVGDPLINATLDRFNYNVFFYGCENGKDCTTIMLQAIFEVPDVSESRMAEWNRDKRFGKAFLSDKGFPTVEYNINLHGGVSTLNLDDSFDWWKLVLTEYADHVGF